MAIRNDRTELLVGLFVFFGLAIMGALIVQFGRFGNRLRQNYEVSVLFPDAGGLIEGAPVKLAGQKVGYVAGEPKLNDEFTAVIVPLHIYAEDKIPLGSRFTVATSGLMGDTYVRIDMPKEPKPEYFTDGETIKGSGGSGLESLQEDAGLVLADIRLAVKDIQVAVQSLDRIFKKIETGMLAEENIENLKTTFAELKKTGENLNRGTEKLDPLMDDLKTTVNEAKTAMTKAGDTFDKAKEVIAKAEPAMAELEPAVADLRETLKKASAAMTEISEGDGVAAALISDTGLRRDLESFVDKLDRYGILGYPKDKSKPAESDSGTDSGRAGTGGPFNRLFNKNR
ncbi:MAG: MCE family protein [Verrucomicrobiae bacterium]|nr:MCE family protein [Verrucomicrobiae bacterium]MCP5539241.1 MCE family protein [Akkermansiaceae bacterium]